MSQVEAGRVRAAVLYIQSAFLRLDLGQTQFSPKAASFHHMLHLQSAGVTISSGSEGASLPTKGKCLSFENSQSCKKIPQLLSPNTKSCSQFCTGRTWSFTETSRKKSSASCNPSPFAALYCVLVSQPLPGSGI